MRDKMKKLPVAVISVLLVCGQAALYPETGALRSLLLPAGARAESMGGVYFAVADGADSVFQNPAGLAADPGAEIFSSFSPRLMDTSLTSAACIIARGRLAIGFNLFSYGNIEINYPDGSSRTVSAGNDSSLRLTYAMRLNKPRESWNFTSGVSVSSVHSYLVGSYSAETLAMDFGLTAREPVHDKWEQGFSLVARNSGNGVRYYESYSPLPTFIGAGYYLKMAFSSLKNAKKTSLLVAAACKQMLNEPERTLSMGAEFGIFDIIFFRFSQDSLTRDVSDNYTKYSIGLGVRMGALHVDYSVSSQYNIYDFTDNLQNISVAYAY